MIPGKRNLITDVSGLKVGNAADTKVRTGVTLLIPDRPVIAAVDVRGGAPGTHETDALRPSGLINKIDGLTLSGGSVYGLAVATALTRLLGARGKGLRLLPPPVPTAPVVPGAILFDLANGGDKDWGEAPPYDQLAGLALEHLGYDFSLGNAGAGFGATAGAYKGGLGSASLVTADGYTVGALIAANPVGSPVMTGAQCFWAWTQERGGEYGGLRPPVGFELPPGLAPDTKLARIKAAGKATVIGVVATDAALTQAEALHLAVMAQDGIAQAVRPSHTPLDGDTVFALATGRREMPALRAVALAELGMMAADCVARALTRGVWEANSLGGFRSVQEVFGI